MVMVMKFKNISVILTVCLSVLSVQMNAQEIAPTVVVNRVYEGSIVDAVKPSSQMAVPDSVTRFDLDFKYSVFDKPYSSAGEFNPFLLTMEPESMTQKPSKLYLKAGAGYPVYPTVDFIWTPAFDRGFRMNVYAQHRSYIGAYRAFKPEAVLSDGIVLSRWTEHGGDNALWNGYDFKTRAGMDISYDWVEGKAWADVSYYGLASRDFYKDRFYDGLDVNLGVASKPSKRGLSYDLSADYRFAEDKVRYKTSNGYVGEHDFSLDGRIGHNVTEGQKMIFDVELDVAAYSIDGMTPLAGMFSMVPHYVYKKNRWSVDAGIRVSKMFRSADAGDLYSAKEQVIYPDIKASFEAVKDAMKIYAGLGGGSGMCTYSSLLEENRHLDMSFGHGIWPVLDNYVERLSASFGFRGRISSIFSYDLYASYHNYSNAPMDAVVVGMIPAVSEPRYLPGLGYASYQKFSAGLDWCLKSESFRFDGGVKYNHVWDVDRFDGLFMPSPLEANAEIEYNWCGRIYAGVDCDFAAGRTGGVLYEGQTYTARIPGWADLGVYFEIAANNSLSFWVRGGNLMNMTIQRSPLYAEKGVNFTAGICLNF